MSPELRESLILAHVDLARRVASRAARGTPIAQREDAVSAGLVALVESVDRFDASRGVPVAAFVSRRVAGAVLDFKRAEDPLTRCARRQVHEGTFVDVDRVPLEEWSESIEVEAFLLEETLIVRQQVRKALRRLPAADRRVLRRYFAQELTLLQIARELSVSESRVCQRIGVMLASMRQTLGIESTAVKQEGIP